MKAPAARKNNKTKNNPFRTAVEKPNGQDMSQIGNIMNWGSLTIPSPTVSHNNYKYKSYFTYWHVAELAKQNDNSTN